MWKKLLELLRTQVFLARDLQENRENIAKLRETVDELSSLMIKLQFEIEAIRQEDRHEREKMLLKMENTLLRFERLLPPSLPKRRK